MTTLAQLLAESYPYWHRPAVAVLALLVVGLLWFVLEEAS